jgi:two-component system, OmpR family, alkaline phosphatase synthesis response regulator PhoP
MSMPAYDLQRSPRLLLIEDNLLLAEATAEFLRDAGLEVQIAESGEEALHTALLFRPDIVLCDMRLPDMSGLDVAKTLRATPVTRNALLVVHTAMSDADLRVLEREMGQDQVNLFLSKPLTEEKLDQMLRARAALRKSVGSQS